jgi:hypothetical protein
MTRARLRNAVTFVAAMFTLGTAVASDAPSAGHSSPRSLAEMKRSLERMPTAQGTTLAGTAPIGRSLSDIKRDVGRSVADAPAAGTVPLSGIPLAKAKRL